MWSALLMTGLMGAPVYGQAVITQAEPDDSIGTANETSIVAGSSLVAVAYGNNGDGAFGDSSGDVDFYKVSLEAGQQIMVNMANAGTDPDFDPLVGLYNSGGVVVAENDDKGGTSRGYDRTPRLVYTAEEAGDYYVCVSSWIGDVNLPSDPFTPGTAPGLPQGSAGDYQLIIAVDGELPVPQFVGGNTGYPVPAFLPSKVFGTPRYDGVLTISNRSAGSTADSNYVITGYSLTGPDADKFYIKGLVPPVTIPPGGELDVEIAFDASGSGEPAKASLVFESNDPLEMPFVLDTSRSPVVGGGLFQVRQVDAPAGVTITSMFEAENLLNGVIEGGIETTGTTAGINFGAGNDGRYGSDSPFLSGGTTPENIVIQVTGTFSIREAGEYTFVAYSDDGQKLLIDGQELLYFEDANVDHFATIDLSEGEHTLEFIMYEGGGGNHAELAISQQPGEYFDRIESTWEILEALGSDTDSDELPDSWEIANMLDPNSADGDNGASGDPDGDTLTNAEEYFIGTNPQVADSDNDSLNDNVETGTGVWIDATDTGTDPLNSDSDMDGLTDSMENLAANPGSDPNKADTDGDSYPDGTELSLMTDPKDANSRPTLSYLPVISDDFDGDSLHSEYSFNSLNGTIDFFSGVYDSGIPARGKSIHLTDYFNALHTSAFFDYVSAPSTQALQLSVDFRFAGQEGVDPADGFGIGLFSTETYGTEGPTTVIVNGKNWENPTGGGGYADALFIGFGVYGADYVRVAGPANPGTLLAEQGPPFELVNNVFNRAIITVLPNTATSSMVSVELVEDVDGIATTRTVVSNLLVEGFVPANTDFRVIAGGRTGGLNVSIELDNVQLKTLATEDPIFVFDSSFNTITGTLYDSPGHIIDPDSLTATIGGEVVNVTATKDDGVTTIQYTTPAGTYLPSGSSEFVITFSDEGGMNFTDTRTLITPEFTILPAGLALNPALAFEDGFKIRMVQMDLLEGGTTPNALDYMEGILAGVSGTPFNGGNVANLSNAQNGIFVSDVINFEQDGLNSGQIPGDNFYPGIPGATGSTDNFVYEALTWVEFPEAGIYRFGVSADDGFRVSYGHDPVPGLTIAAPAEEARIVPFLPSENGSQEGGLAGPFPEEPFTAGVVMANPATAINLETGEGLLNNADEVAGKILLVDRGDGTFAAKILAGQAAGALAVIIINENNPNLPPAGLGGDGTGITIPAGMISKGQGDQLKSLINDGLMLTFGRDESTTIGKSSIYQAGVTEFSAVVTQPGLYPIRFMNYEGGGGANSEWFSIDSEGGMHLVNDPNDPAALRAYSELISELAITDVNYNVENDTFTLTFTSVKNRIYQLWASPDLTSFGVGIEDNIVGEEGLTTFGPFFNPFPGSGKGFFRIQSE